MPFANRELVNADGAGRGLSRQGNLLLHVECIQIFHRTVVQAFHLSHGLVRHTLAQLAHMQGKALRIARIRGEPV